MDKNFKIKKDNRFKRKAEAKPPEIAHSTPLSQVERIKQFGGQKLERREDVKIWVEEPLVAACEILYDKNIITVSSSANEDDAYNGPFIIIDYDTLSPNNQRIAKNLRGEVYEARGRKVVELQIPVKENPYPDEVKQAALLLVARFEQQKSYPL